jgi:hypothetical protein
MQQSDRRAKFLKDYAPPDYLIEEVNLDVALSLRRLASLQSCALGPIPKSQPAAGRSCSTARP